MDMVGELVGFASTFATRNRGEAEVEHLYNALWRNHDVGRFQIAMRDAFFVRGFQRVRDLLGVVESGLQRERSFERPTGDQLHRQCTNTI